MAFGRKGKRWETESRKWLEEMFPGHIWVKLINPESVDWFGIGPHKSIMMVEAKHVKKVRKRKTMEDVIIYYPKSTKRKRAQLKTYFDNKKYLESLGYDVDVALLICKGPVNGVNSEIIYTEVDSYDDVETSY